MHRSLLAIAAVVAVLAGGLAAADDKNKTDKPGVRPTNATITKIDARKGEVTVRTTDAKGKAQEKTFQLTKDVRLLDETGRVTDIAVFESGNEALIIESEGKLRELRRAPGQARARQLSDSVRTLVEMADCEQGCTEELQRIYTMLRKLDTGKNGKIDPQALKVEANQILQERVKDVFNRLDTNKDGKISKDEARGLIKEHFDQIDKNKDGFIEFNELLQAAKERREHKAAEGRPTDTNPTAKEKK